MSRPPIAKCPKLLLWAAILLPISLVILCLIIAKARNLRLNMPAIMAINSILTSFCCATMVQVMIAVVGLKGFNIEGTACFQQLIAWHTVCNILTIALCALSAYWVGVKMAISCR